MRAALLSLLLPLLLAAPREVVAPSERLTDRVLFVVDASGSMHGTEFGVALRAVRSIAGQPVDALEFGIIAFSDVPSRWPGLAADGEDLPAGWAACPSSEAVDRAEEWLSEHGADGDTRAIPALRMALEEQRDRLSVVLVTDGGFYSETEAAIVAAVEAAQVRREELGLGRAVLLVYGVGLRTKPVLEALGSSGRGGYFHEDTTRDEPH